MSQAAPNSVIHRKTRVARDEYDAREMSPAKALRLSIEKTAEALFHLALVVRTVDQLAVPLAQLEEVAGDNGMLIILDGPDGLRGAVRLDCAFVSSLIEVQLVGQLREATPEERPFTHTDAAIVQPLIDDLLVRFNETLIDDGLQSAADGFRFGDMVESARTLVLSLEAQNYDLYSLKMDLGPGKRTGNLDFFLPHRPHFPDADQNAGDGGLATKLEKTAMNAPVTLNAALTRLRLPLNQILEWAPGTCLPLGVGLMNEGVLLGARNHEVARLRLGQLDGLRAVRLLTGSVPEEEKETAAHDGEEAGDVRQQQITLHSDDPPTLSNLNNHVSQSADLLDDTLLDDERLGPDDNTQPSEWSALDGLDILADGDEAPLFDQETPGESAPYPLAEDRFDVEVEE